MAEATLSVTSERHDPNALYLHGDITSASIGALVGAVDEIVAHTQRGVVLDLTDVSVVTASTIEAINAVAAHTSALGRQLTLRVPDGAFETLDALTQNSGVHIERTHLLHVAPGRIRPDPTAPAVPRKQGAGFVPSYGEGRQCSAHQCQVVLSRYNPNGLCFLHWSGR